MFSVYFLSTPFLFLTLFPLFSRATHSHSIKSQGPWFPWLPLVLYKQPIWLQNVKAHIRVGWCFTSSCSASDIDCISWTVQESGRCQMSVESFRAVFSNLFCLMYPHSHASEAQISFTDTKPEMCLFWQIENGCFTL